MNKFEEHISNILLQMVRTKVAILMEAIEADHNIEKQLSIKTMVAIGNFDSTPQGAFQLNVELVIKPEYFLPDGNIVCITEREHDSVPYYTILPKSN